MLKFSKQLLYYIFPLGIKTCTRGFPDFPAALGTRDGGNTDTTVTILIPDMNFTCNAKIAGFTFAGINRQNMGRQDPVIQIWQENSTQLETGGTIYHKTGPAIAINTSKDVGACDDGLPKITTGSRIYLCILRKDFQVSVQPGDILGLELPSTNDDDFDIMFIKGGPDNYIFLQQVNSTVDLSLSNHQSLRAQLPQITFRLTSGTD